LVSTGRVTSYAPDGSLNWQTSTPSTWGEKVKKASKESVALQRAFLPSINPFALDTNSLPVGRLSSFLSLQTKAKTKTKLR